MSISWHKIGNLLSVLSVLMERTSALESSRNDSTDRYELYSTNKHVNQVLIACKGQKPNSD